MRNQLTQRPADRSRYFAMGELDDCSTSVIALDGTSIVLGFGLISVGLSRDAAAELAVHLTAALNAGGGAQ